MSYLSVREMQEGDIEHYIIYWLAATPEYLAGMGVDVSKKPTPVQITTLIKSQLFLPFSQKQSYFITWLKNDLPVGCCNVNQVVFGSYAYMHFHIWNSVDRCRGTGAEFVRQSLPFYFINLKLKQLFCEPFALNPATNKTIEKIGFEFIKQQTTIPGASNFEQIVNLWSLSKKKFEEIHSMI